MDERFEDTLRIDLRRLRADQLTALVMQTISKYLGDGRTDRRDAARALLELFYEGGFEVIGDEQRAAAGLPPRGETGWTERELAALEMRRFEAMSRPISMIVPNPA